jgi:dienelactone hydrolase
VRSLHPQPHPPLAPARSRTARPQWRQFQAYPEAYHAFDAASGIEKPHSAYGHMVAYDPSATADAHKRVPEFLYRYLH